MLIAPLDERANRRRGGVQHVDFVFLDDRPEAIFSGPVRGTFVHHLRCPGRHRSVDDVAVTGDPTAVGGTPKDIVRLVIEDPLECSLDVQIIASGGMPNPFRFSGRSAGVENEQRVFAIDGKGFALVAYIAGQIVPPDIAAFGHRYIVSGSSIDNALFDRRTFGEGLIDDFLEVQDFPASIASIGRDLEFGF